MRAGRTDGQKILVSYQLLWAGGSGGLLKSYFWVRNKIDLGHLVTVNFVQGTKIAEAFAGVGLVGAGCGIWRCSL